MSEVYIDICLNLTSSGPISKQDQNVDILVPADVLAICTHK